jgi:hypothetical protein
MPRSCVFVALRYKDMHLRPLLANTSLHSPHTLYSELTASLAVVMPSAHISDLSFGESEHPSGPEPLLAAEGFSLTPQDASILKEHLEDFQKADTELRKKILEKVMGELYALRPQPSTFDKKEAKKVLILKFSG